MGEVSHFMRLRMKWLTSDFFALLLNAAIFACFAGKMQIPHVKKTTVGFFCAGAVPIIQPRLF